MHLEQLHTQRGVERVVAPTTRERDGERADVERGVVTSRAFEVEDAQAVRRDEDVVGATVARPDDHPVGRGFEVGGLVEERALDFGRCAQLRQTLAQLDDCEVPGMAPRNPVLLDAGRAPPREHGEQPCVVEEQRARSVPDRRPAARRPATARRRGRP